MHSDTTEISPAAAWIVIAAAAAQLVSLLTLHILSPEFDPGWRVVSEYAHGQFGWLLSLMFLFDAVSVWSLAYLLRSQIQTNAGRAGWALLIVSGVGTAGAAAFTIDHPLHEPCALASILGLTVAAMMISVSLGRTTPWSQLKAPLLWAAHLTWISLALFVMTMAILIVTYTRTGATIEAAIPLGAPLPEGVIGINGWTNRLLLMPFWTVTLAWSAIKLRRGGLPRRRAH